MITKNCGDIPKFKNNSGIVLTVIHSFGAVIEQLSLSIEIMVKCSLVTKVWIYLNAVVLGNGKWELIHTLE